MIYRDQAPYVTVVIPVYDEETILESAVRELLGRLDRFGWSYELVLSENGSTDATRQIASDLAREFPQVRQLNTEGANYGRALQRGILEARGQYVICDEIDLCDTDFHQRAMAILETGGTDFVVGSKVAAGSEDQRPLVRRLGTLIINGLLRALLGFKGTDTHGLKAFRRRALSDLAERCVVDRDLFASEFVIRSERAGIGIREIPVRVLEKRPPSIHLLRRVPNVLFNMGRLVLAIRLKS
ncbi:MAG: glycosyltransferase [Proteobacteria bacterium]|nr:glycosyltransferase [Pseudomonadota bacterium]